MKELLKDALRCIVIIVLLVLFLSLAGCSSVFTQIPVDEAGQPIVSRETITVLNPAIEEKVDVALDVWCRNLSNVRRIALRFIHVLDPEWQTVCQAREVE